MEFLNIHGQPIDWANLRAKAAEERKRNPAMYPQQRKPTVKNGYAAPPGTGPEGKTCKDCQHKQRLGNYGGKSYIKCLLRQATWTHGEGTDILARSPACNKFEQRAPVEQTAR
jgi:hypothetical protein